MIKFFTKKLNLVAALFLFAAINSYSSDLPLFWWKWKKTNFGDALSLEIVRRIIGYYPRYPQKEERKLLALGSIMSFASDNDVIWGTGVNGNYVSNENNKFKTLDVRAVRGPLTRQFLLSRNIDCPEIFGDPALLMPLLFSEFKATFSTDYVIIPHISEIPIITKLNEFKKYPNIVLPTEDWKIVVAKILESKFVISSSLHGIIVAEAYGIPARYLRLTNNEHLFKYEDYYRGTGRNSVDFAQSIEEAFEKGGKEPAVCNLNALLNSFPYDQFQTIIEN